MKRKTYPLRISPEILSAMQRWANDDLRSLNAQIEFVLRDALSRTGRYKKPVNPEEAQNTDDSGQ